MRREYTKEELENAVKDNFGWVDVCKHFGKVPSTRTYQFFREECIKKGVSFAHFDRSKRNRDRTKHVDIVKICPHCSKEFETKSGGGKARDFCSRICANSHFDPEVLKRRGESIKKAFYLKYPNGNKKATRPRNKNTDKPTKPKKVKPTPNALIRRACLICDAKVKAFHSIYCSLKCSNESKRRSAKNGTHIGWKSRKITSFPERFFKKVFELNGLGDKFILNAPVPKKSLGLDCIARYFLDFYFPHIKLDVEIDGKQHNFPERIASDKIRNDALIANGYIVYRIPWKSINNAKGKEFIRQEIAKLLSKIKDLEQQLA